MGDVHANEWQFHRGEYTVRQVKEYLARKGLLVRDVEEGQDV